MPYVIAQPCVDVKGQGLRGRVPRRLHFTRVPARCTSTPTSASTAVHANRCAPPRPSSMRDDLPDEWAWYKDAAVNFFAEVGGFGRRFPPMVQSAKTRNRSPLPPPEPVS